VFHSNHGDGAGRASGVDLSELRHDLNSLQETVAKLLSKTKDDSAKSVREMTRNITDRVSTMAGDLAHKSPDAASAATDQVKSLATKATNQFKSFGAELESMADRNPFGAVAGALLVGILIGMLGRRS
jgi:ElaB/YqjD/DUF883 family membrane-anchored ribosome-binding protein